MEDATPSIGSVVTEDGGSGGVGFEVELDVKSWVKEQTRLEVERLKGLGSMAIPVEVKNTGIVTESDGTTVNRIEAATAFDFDRIERILVSEPIQCEPKPAYNFVHVICFTSKPIPLILCHLYPATQQKRKQKGDSASGTKNERTNTLSEWLFVNARLQTSRHSISSFDVVRGESSSTEAAPDDPTP